MPKGNAVNETEIAKKTNAKMSRSGRWEGGEPED
jgi:hypothetical protein